MSFDLNQFLQTVTATGFVIAALAFLSKAVLNHLLARDIERQKLELKANSDEALESYKNELKVRADRALEEIKQQHMRSLAAAQHEAQQKLEEFRAEMGLRTSRKERIREELLHWANPVLGTVTELERGLNNILYNGGFLALSRESEERINPDWSISYDYFMQSTLYLFAQYFCCVRLLQLRLSFELFESQREQTRFFDAIQQVSKALATYPAPQFSGKGRDRQVFSLQQRAIGEALILPGDRQAGCMGYHEFVRRLDEPAIREELVPLRNLLEGLNPEEERRWKRLKAVHAHLQALKKVCEELLQVHKEEPRPDEAQASSGSEEVS